MPKAMSDDATAGMSAERLAEIRRMSQIENVNAGAAKVLLPLQIRELLAEVERLRGVEAELRRRAEQLDELLGISEQARNAEERDRRALRAQLAEIGETRQEWAADGPGGRMQWPIEGSEAYARDIVTSVANAGVEVRLMRRLVGEWREVPDA